jgi:hypothetical protein
MFEQMMDLSRKWAETYMQAQHTVLEQWTQGFAPPVPSGLSSDPSTQTRRRWSDLLVDGLTKHREWVDASYKLGIQSLERSLRIYSARSPDEALSAVEDAWRGMFEGLRALSELQVRDVQFWTLRCVEAQFREVQSWGQRYVEMTHHPNGHAPSSAQRSDGARPESPRPNS